MDIEINKNSKTPIYVQIKNQMSDKIISGEWEKGFSLPSERELSKILGVNRSTINKAYWDLKSENLIASNIGSGTFVYSQISKNGDNFDAYVPKIEWNQIMKTEYETQYKSLIKEAVEAVNKEGVISFSGGFVGNSDLPIDYIEDISKKCFSKYGEKLLSPTSVYGLLPLRKEICNYMRKIGVKTNFNECIILSGSQQGLDFFGKTLINNGDMVFVEAPSYIGAIEIFKGYGAKVVGIPIDEYGMNVEVLENYLLRYRPKFIYTNPTYQNPSGTSLSFERRKKLLELAYLYQIPILEDDPYSDIKFENKKYPSLKAMDTHGYVTYLGTFSKKFYMGGRIGWVISSPDVVRRFGNLKQITDLHTNTISQYFILESLKAGIIDEHIQKLISRVMEKRDLMVFEINGYRMEDVEFIVPNGGYYIWLKLPKKINSSIFLENCKKNKVAVMPGEPCFAQGVYNDSYVRLNYSYPDLSQIAEGVRRLMVAINNSQNSKQNILEHGENLNNPIV